MSQQSFAIVLDVSVLHYIIYIYFFLSGHHLFEIMNLLFFCAQLSAVGDFVAEDESVGEIETDKVSLW